VNVGHLKVKKNIKESKLLGNVGIAVISTFWY
jgi:hypothetical protein